MTINIKIETQACAIDVAKDCFIPTTYGINTVEGSANFGKPTFNQLGYFSGDNSFGRAVNKLIQHTLASSDDKLSLQEYAERVEAATASVLEQLKEWDKIRKEA